MISKEFEFSLNNSTKIIWEQFINMLSYYGEPVRNILSSQIGLVRMELVTELNEEILLEKLSMILKSLENKSNEEKGTGTEKKELEVVLQRDINSYLHWALPMCIVKSNDKFAAWHNERFIQVYSLTQNYDENTYIFTDFADKIDSVKLLFRNWDRYRYEDLNDVKNIAEFVIEKINMGFYIIIFLDEYYLPQKHFYNVRHFVHPSLIYGYDNNAKEFLSISFDKMQTFTKMSYSYDLFVKAYEGGKLYFIMEDAGYAEHKIVQVIQPHRFDKDYPFDIKHFLSELHNYIFSISDPYKKHICRDHQWRDKNVADEAKIVCGFDVYDDVVENLQKLAYGKSSLDYRMIHLLYEHKEGMYKKLKYLAYENNFSSEFTKYVGKYEKIVEGFKEARFLFIKFLHLKKPEILQKIIDIININKKLEKAVLEYVYHYLTIPKNNN